MGPEAAPYIIGYGGVSEIGGSMFLIANSLPDRRELLLIDFGKSFRKWQRFYRSPFLQPRSINELRLLGIVPPDKGDLTGLYKDSTQPPQLAACIISHAHFDHIGYVPLINRAIPIHVSRIMWKQYVSRLKASRKSGVEADISGLQDVIHYFPHSDTPYQYRTLPNIDTPVQPFPVDHSIPAAFAFFLELNGTTLLYTGDFRRHGTVSSFVDQMCRTLAGKIDYLLCDNTSMTHATGETESGVEQRARRIVDRAPGLVIAQISCNDLDRLQTFLRVAKTTNRCLVIDLHLAYYLAHLTIEEENGQPKLAYDQLSLRNFPYDAIGPNVPSDEKARLFVPYSVRQSKKGKTSTWKTRLANPTEKTSEFFHLARSLFGDSIDENELFRNGRNYLLLVGGRATYELADFLRELGKALRGAVFILSHSEPFDEEGEIDHRRLCNWLRVLGIPYVHIHSSGHITPTDLITFVEELQPKYVIPIHTEAPNVCKHFLEPVVGEDRILLLKPATPLPLTA